VTAASLPAHHAFEYDPYDSPPLDGLEIAPARRHGWSLRYRGQGLTSAVDAVKEARRRLDQGPRRDNADTVICVGGANINRITVLRDEGRTVIWLEPRPLVLRSLLEYTDLPDMLADGHLILIAYKTRRFLRDRLADAMTSLSADRIATDVDDATNTVLTLDTAALLSDISSVLKAVRSEDRITLTFAPQWVRHFCRNLGAMTRGVEMAPVRRTYEGADVLLISAGPSLEEIGPDPVREAARRCPVCCVDTVYPVLKRWDVPVDFVVSVDGQYINTKHLRYGGGDERTIAVLESGVCPLSIATFPRILPFHCGSPLGQHLPRLPFLRSGGSVITVAFSFLRRLGVGRIIGCGLDFCVPAEVTSHTRGTYHQRHALVHSGRTRPAVSLTRRDQLAGAYQTRDHTGRAVTTTPSLQQYADWLNAEIEAAGVPLLNCSPRSLLRGDLVRHTTLAAVHPELLDAKPVHTPVAAAVDSAEYFQNPGLLTDLAKTKQLTKRLESALYTAKPDTGSIRECQEGLNESESVRLFSRFLKPYEREAGLSPAEAVNQREQVKAFLRYLRRLVNAALPGLRQYQTRSEA